MACSVRPTNCTLGYSKDTNAITLAWSAGLRTSKLVLAVVAWPLWRAIASATVTLAPSCMKRVRTLLRHSGAVRSWLRVP